MAAFNQNAYLKQQQGLVNSSFDQQKKAQLAQFNAEKNKALGLVNQQKAKVAPQYAIQRNQADVGHAQSASRLREMMAANGISASGENVTANVGLQSARQGVLGQLNLQEQETNNDFNRQILDINDTSKLSAMIAELDSQRSRALNEATMRADELGYARSRDSLADKRYADETQYERNLQLAEDRRRAEALAYSRKQDAIAASRRGSSRGGGSYGSSSYGGSAYAPQTKLPAKPTKSKIMTERQYIDAYEQPNARHNGTARVIPGSSDYEKKMKKVLSDLYN